MLMLMLRLTEMLTLTEILMMMVFNKLFMMMMINMTSMMIDPHDPHVMRMRAWRRARLRICGKFAASGVRGGSKILTLLGHSDSPRLLFSDTRTLLNYFPQTPEKIRALTHGHSESQVLPGH